MDMLETLKKTRTELEKMGNENNTVDVLSTEKPKVAKPVEIAPTMEEEQNKIDFKRDFSDEDLTESKYDLSDPDSAASIDEEMRNESMADGYHEFLGEAIYNKHTMSDVEYIKWLNAELAGANNKNKIIADIDSSYKYEYATEEPTMRKAWKKYEISKGLIERNAEMTKPKKNIPGKIYNADNPKDADAFVNRINASKVQKPDIDSDEVLGASIGPEHVMRDTVDPNEVAENIYYERRLGKSWGEFKKVKVWEKEGTPLKTNAGEDLEIPQPVVDYYDRHAHSEGNQFDYIKYPGSNVARPNPYHEDSRRTHGSKYKGNDIVPTISRNPPRAQQFKNEEQDRIASTLRESIPEDMVDHVDIDDLAGKILESKNKVWEYSQWDGMDHPVKCPQCGKQLYESDYLDGKFCTHCNYTDVPHEGTSKRE
jgi:hypothetical protein